jgi:putative hydrolase of the HAD superfamily
MIKTVIFDLGRVLVPFDFNIGYRKLEALCGIPAAEIPARLAATKLVNEIESGRISADEFNARLGEAFGFRITSEEFRELWCSVFLPHALVPEELVEMIGRTHRLLLLSNTSAVHFEMLREAYPILRHFHAYILSYEVGAMKPEQRIYEAAIAAAACAPQECFFTDDIPDYVEGARRMGIDAVQFQSGEQIATELKTRGVI